MTTCTKLTWWKFGIESEHHCQHKKEVLISSYQFYLATIKTFGLLVFLCFFVCLWVFLNQWGHQHVHLILKWSLIKSSSFWYPLSSIQLRQPFINLLYIHLCVYYICVHNTYVHNRFNKIFFGSSQLESIFHKMHLNITLKTIINLANSKAFKFDTFIFLCKN